MPANLLRPLLRSTCVPVFFLLLGWVSPDRSYGASYPICERLVGAVTVPGIDTPLEDAPTGVAAVDVQEPLRRNETPFFIAKLRERLRAKARERVIQSSDVEGVVEAAREKRGFLDIGLITCKLKDQAFYRFVKMILAARGAKGPLAEKNTMGRQLSVIDSNIPAPVGAGRVCAVVEGACPIFGFRFSDVCTGLPNILAAGGAR